MNIRPATRDDFVAVCGRLPQKMVRALVLEDETGPVAIGGYVMIDGAALAFSESKRPLRKREAVKGAHAVIEMLKSLKIDICAEVGDDGPAVVRHFGFEPEEKFWRLRAWPHSL